MESPFFDPARDIKDPAEREIWRIFGELPAYSEDDYLNLSRRDRFVFDLWWYDIERLNGGMWQYFYNSIGDHWPACLEALQEVGAKQWHHELKQACELFPNGQASTNREERQRQIAELEMGGKFDDLLDARLAATASESPDDEENLYQLLLDYYQKAAP